MSAQSLTVLFPPGRFVQGSMYKAQDKDFTTGQPRVYPPGHKNAGQPKISYFFAVAYPKTPGVGHWGAEEWGKQIWAFGHQAWPNGQATAPTFAWKIEDGDSAVPNKAGRKNCDREGFRGHWIVNFSSAFAPKLYTRDSSGRPQDLIQADAVQPGDFVQVQGTIDSNETQGNPGIYINHQMVMFLGYHPEGRIRQGADPNAVQWAAPPAGASTVPPGGTMPALPGAPAAPAVPGAPPPPAAPALVPVAAPAAPAPAPTPVAPSATFIAPAPAGAAPPPPPAAPAAPAAPVGPQMTPKAAGQTYAAFIAAGWSDAQLRAQGYMV